MNPPALRIPASTKLLPLLLLQALALATIIAGLFWSIQASAYPRHDGEYLFWSQMPEAARVLADIKGRDDLDRAGHQHAALMVLINLVHMAADGTGQTPWPAREQELNHAYLQALPTVKGHQSEVLAESSRLQKDRAFVQMVLKRYFSAEAVDEINKVGAFAPGQAQPVNVQSQGESVNAQSRGPLVGGLGANGAVGAYPLHQGEYLFWPQMPKAARVVADMKGTDEFDTAVRQAAALDLLQELVRVNMEGKGNHYPTPLEDELNTSYIHALPWAKRGINGSFQISAKALRLDADPSFVEPFLKRYFSADAVREIEPLIPEFGSNALKNIDFVEMRAKKEVASQQAQRGKMPAPTGAQSLAQTWNQSTPEDKSQIKTIVAVLCVLFVIFVYFWWSRILRAFTPLKMTSDDPPQFKGRFSSYEICTSTGIVSGSATRSTTSVSGSIRTVGGNAAMGIPSRVEGSVTSTTTVIDSFRLVDPVRHKEANFQLKNFGLQLWEGQVASVAWAVRGDERTYMVVVNHTTDQVFCKKKPVRDLYTRPSTFWTLVLAFSFLIPPLWLIIIPWGILVEIQTGRFCRTGIQPLLKALNQKAQRFLQG